ncbi:acyl carrier protein [Actinokineospora diospyrosa]|uniref:Acyl carrier protein n=1 Tax=Actinokineospora diospyrosa TaxID=103728 RepID=A0ABT1I9T7_9PSEU|nr:acyl carrier protein [Actinokineospora diospyrosa]MCP2269405.1 acyl carrier protein [Actinokineospora diospyrosa]
MTQITATLDELREIAADVLEVEPEEVSDDGLFAEEHDTDSLRAIELLARVEKRYKVDIPQQELPNMVSLRALHDVVAKYAVRG